MQTGTLAPPPAAPGSTALLWDLDNVAPPREQLGSLAEAICLFVAAEESMLAAGHRTNYRASRTLLADLGIQALSGGRRRNGADRVLLDHARRLSDQGVSRFVIASNDSRFAQVAQFADLHVLTLTDDYLSGRLRAAASTVTVLAHRHRGWVPIPSPGRTARDVDHPATRAAVQFPSRLADPMGEGSAIATAAARAAAVADLSVA